jgi:urease accessory protein
VRPSAALLLLADGRLPAGGYAHSGGLEAAVAAGLGADGVPDFLAGRLHGVAHAEATLAVHARRAAAAGDLALVRHLEAEAEARCLAPPLRDAARRLGRQLLRTALEVWPASTLLVAYRDRGGVTPRPVVHGVVAAAAGLDDAATALAYLHEDAAMVTSAATRLLPVDPAVAARWLAQAGPTIEALADAAAADRRVPERLPAGFAPLVERYATDHDHREDRLFVT